MHEISLMTSIMDIASQEMQKHGADKLISLTVRHGVLSNVVADSMYFAFDALTKNTSFEGATLNLIEEKLSLECSCGHVFSPDKNEYFYLPCPACKEKGSYKVLAGEGIFLDRLEADKSNSEISNSEK